MSSLNDNDFWELEMNDQDIEAVQALDDMPAGDAEGAHGMADDILLSLVHPEVRAAYERVKDRAPWWAAA